MSDQPVFTRREFLNSSLMLISAATVMPMFVHRSALAASDPFDSPLTKSRPGVMEDRILVVVQLGGGNDGLNAVVPYGNPAYYKARPSIGIGDKEVLKLDLNSGIGLNPELVDLKAMYDEGMAAIVQGVGYPNPNRSHFVSMDIWQTADPGGGKGLGWLGKAMDEFIATNPKAAQQTQGGPCICLGNESPLAMQGRRVKPVSFQRPDLFRWVGSDLHPALAKEYDKLNRTPPVNDANDPLSFVMRTSMDAQVASERIRDAVKQAPVTSFNQGPLAYQLKMVAAMIRANLPARVYYVTLGGFDTHANQPGNQGRQLREFASSIKSFYAELAAIGQKSRVVTMAFSEFGRRVEQNASNGTDHGTAGPVFLFGQSIKPGLLGTYPSLTELDHGDLIHTVDFRSVYADVLDNWLKLDSSKVLGTTGSAPGSTKRFEPFSVMKV